MSTMTTLWDLVGPVGDDGKPRGPVRTEVNTVLAKEAMGRDPKRYAQDLPKGASPGPAEADRLERQAQLERELKGDLPDPHFPQALPGPDFGRPRQ